MSFRHVAAVVACSLFLPVAGKTAPPPATNRPMSGDASYNVLPLTINGNPPNLPAGTTLNGSPIGGGGGTWGSITGTLSNQTDLQAALDAKQPLDADLTAIAALTTTSFGRSFLDRSDAAAGRTLLGLGTLATQNGTFSGTSSGTNTGDQDLSGLVPNTRTVNGHALSSNVTVTTGDLGATTVGGNIFTLTNPSAITFLRMNADNTVDALSASAFRTAIGAGVGGGDALTSNPLSQFASTTSSQFKGVISDENAPDGASSKVIMALGSLSIVSGKTATFSNTLTFTGTDSSSVAFGAGGTVLYGNQTITLSGDVTGSGATAITTTLAAGSASNLNSGTLPAGRMPALTGDVTTSAGAVATTLGNIPTATTMAGSLLATAIAAPGTPASGKGSVYVDSTSKNIAVKNDTGTVNHGVQTRAASANNWIRSIADDGSSTISQPAFTDISGIASATQVPHSVTFVCDGSGSVLTTGTKAYVYVRFGGTLQGWLLMGSPSGSITVDIFRAADGAGLPVTSIVGGSGTKPALSSAVQNTSTSFTNWTSTMVTANDIMAISLSGITTTTYVSLTLYYQ